MGHWNVFLGHPIYVKETMSSMTFNPEPLETFFGRVRHDTGLLSWLVRQSICPSAHPSARPSARPSVRPVVYTAVLRNFQLLTLSQRKFVALGSQKSPSIL